MLARLPEGKLICTRNDTRYKWYNRINNQLIYIPKKERAFAQQLANKKYLFLLLEEMYNKLSAIDAYLSKYDISKCSKVDSLLSNSGYCELISCGFKHLSEGMKDWVNAPYNTNPKYKENLIYKTISGGYVRSKSEELIDMALYMKGIPFRYECELVLGETIIYPDFTILHPISRKIYYWEHFGMMDDETYVKNAFNKMQLYTLNGIIPSINLITTYETKSEPLGSEVIHNIIKDYF